MDVRPVQLHTWHLEGACIDLIMCHHFLETLYFLNKRTANYIGGSGREHPVQILISTQNVCHTPLICNHSKTSFTEDQRWLYKWLTNSTFSNSYTFSSLSSR